MIYSLLNGRLGNCLFQIAAGASLAKRLDVPFYAVADDGELLRRYMPPHAGYLDNFKTNILRKINFVDKIPELPVQNEKGPYYTILPETDNVVLNGYFQSEKYFDKELVRSLFQINDDIRRYIETKYGDILNKNIVAIGVRRGDYLKLGNYYTVCDMYYYRKAMKYFGADNYFLVISDDQEWCKEHIKGKNIFFSDNESAIVDLYLHSLCKHNIIANSTFAWWGAWLNTNPDKVVVYPRPWFGVAHSDISTSDLCPPEWISIPARNGLYNMLYTSKILYKIWVLRTFVAGKRKSFKL